MNSSQTSVQTSEGRGRLAHIFFSYNGYIGRADYIYGITYLFFLFFVCGDVFVNSKPVFLYSGFIDFFTLAQYVVSFIGFIWFFWAFFALVIKRLRTLGWDTRLAVFAVLCPLVLLCGLVQDDKKIEYPSGFSWVDQGFFLIVIALLTSGVFVFHRLDFVQQCLMVGCLLIALILLVCYIVDRFSFRTRVAPKYMGLDVWIDLIFVLVLVLFLRIYIAAPFQIIGPSMETTFIGGTIHTQIDAQYGDGEYIVADRLTYRLKSPRRGDVVVFTPGVERQRKHLIKRVIGLPGDTVRIRDGFVAIKNSQTGGEFVALNEAAYLGKNNGQTCVGFCAQDAGNEHLFEVPTGTYFLMGDNRLESLDSRRCFSNSGCRGDYLSARFVPQGNLLGRVAYSLGHFDILSRLMPPKLGTFSWTVPFRGSDIIRSYDYPELPSSY